MKAQKHNTIEYIINKLDTRLVDPISRMDQRKVIKSVINEYIEYMFNELINNRKFVIRNVGTLIPTDLKIGKKYNHFTDAEVEERYIKRIRFKPSDIIKRILRSRH